MNSFEQKKVNREFAVPYFKSIFDGQKCPLDSSSQIDAWIKDIYEVSEMQEKEFIKRIKGNGIVVSYLFPQCQELDRYENLFKLVLILFLIDDITEDGVQSANGDVPDIQLVTNQLLESLVLIETNASPEQTDNWKPYTKYLYLLLKDIYSSYNETQRKRFIKYFRQFFTQLIRESAIIESKPKFQEFVQFVQIRSVTCGCYIFFQALEYAHNISLTEEEWNNPLMQHFLEQVTDVCYTINDVYSFEKEYIDKKKRLDKMSNVVAFRALRLNITIDEAMKESIEHTVQTEHKCKQLSEEIVSKSQLKPDVKRFIRAVELLIGGNHKSSAQSERYNKF